MKSIVIMSSVGYRNTAIYSCSGPYYRRRRRVPYGPPYSTQPHPPAYSPSAQPTARLPTGQFNVGVACEGSGGLDDVVSSRFGRCPTFTIVNIENNEIKEVKSMTNQAAYAGHGAGVAAVQALASQGVKVVIAGRFGPWATSTCNELGIQTIVGAPDTRVRDAIEMHILKRG